MTAKALQQPAAWHNIGPMTISGWLMSLPSEGKPTGKASSEDDVTGIRCEGDARLSPWLAGYHVDT